MCDVFFALIDSFGSKPPVDTMLKRDDFSTRRQVVIVSVRVTLAKCEVIKNREECVVL